MQRDFFHHNKRGQAALILIFLAAAALIFFAATLNWGTIVQVKTQTTIAATNASTSVSSIFASDAQSEWHTQLKGATTNGQPGFCSKSSIWGFIISLVIIIIIIIIVIVTWGAATPLLTVAGTAITVGMMSAVVIALALTALILQVVVVQPGLTALWNRLQASLPAEAYFMERGLSTGVNLVVSDDGMLPDYFDMDTDGKFRGNSDDKISRFGFYYTERLKALQPPVLKGINVFAQKSQELLNGDPSRVKDCGTLDQNKDKPCCIPHPKVDVNGKPLLVNGQMQIDPAYQVPSSCTWFLNDACTNTALPQCNPCCVPLYSGRIVPNPDYQPNGGYNRFYRTCKANPDATCPAKDCTCSTVNERIRPASCTDSENVNLQKCTQNNPYGSAYPYIYRPYSQEYSNNYDVGHNEDPKRISFLERLGNDDENPHYYKNSGGTFPDVPYGTQIADSIGKFRAADTTGWYATDKQTGSIYPFLWKMAGGVDLAGVTVPATVAATPEICQWCANGAAACDLSRGTTPAMTLTNKNCSGDNCCAYQFANSTLDHTSLDSRVMDNVSGFSNDFVAGDKECPNPTADVTQSKWWKKGVDVFCSNKWPYDDCDAGETDTIAKSCLTGPSANTCGTCTPGLGATHNDMLDTMVNQMPQFMAVIDKIFSMSADDLRSGFAAWYPNIAEWIAPQCNEIKSYCAAHSQSFACSVDVCNQGSEGHLREWRRLMGGSDGVDANGNPKGGLYKKVDDWLNKDFSTGTEAWCVPSNPGSVTADESYYINLNGKQSTGAPGVWGDLGHVTACMDYNVNKDWGKGAVGNTGRFQMCSNSCSVSNCQPLPRSLVVGFDANAGYTFPVASSGAPKTVNTNPPQVFDKQGDLDAEIDRLNNCKAMTQCPPAGQCGIRANAPATKTTPAITLAGECASWGDASATKSRYYTEVVKPLNDLYTGTICADANFKQYVAQSQQLAVNQMDKMRVRESFLMDLRHNAEKARDMLRTGYQHFNDFLGDCDGENVLGTSPSCQLMQDRKDLASYTSEFDNFLIYGWQGDKKAVVQTDDQGKVTSRGYWHIVRVEAQIPTHCPSGLCGADRLPWVRTYQKGFLGMTRCYVLESYTGNIIVRVTRWDEERSGGNIVNFANKVKLWGFSNTNPKSPSTGSTGDLYATCGGVGVLPITREALGVSDTWQVPPINSPGLNNFSNEELNEIRNAFMINRASCPKRISTETKAQCLNDQAAHQQEAECYRRVSELLKGGVKSVSCAQYYFDGGRMTMKFIACPNNAFQDDVTLTSTDTDCSGSTESACDDKP